MDKNNERLDKEILLLLEKVSKNNRPFGTDNFTGIQEEKPFPCKQEDIENSIEQYQLPKISLDTYKQLEESFGIGENLLPNSTKNHNKNIDNIIARLEENLEDNTSMNEKPKEYKKSIFDFETRRYKY